MSSSSGSKRIITTDKIVLIRLGKHFLDTIIQHFNNRPRPFVSIIVPTFQEEKILENCLSIFTPELKKKYSFELIVSDGGSTDRTIEIAKKYADTIVTYSGKEKQGIAQGRNCGESVANGEVLIFLNGDTIMTNPEHFLAFVHLWGQGKTEDSSAPALACRVEVFPEEKIWKDVIFYAVHNQYVRLLNAIGLGMCRGECQIIKRNSFISVGRYHGHLTSGEDFELFTRLAKLGRIKFINSLVVLESPRRFRRQGYIRTLVAWTVNSIFVLFCNKSFSKEWKDIR